MEKRGLVAIGTLATEFDETDVVDRMTTLREAYYWEDYTAMVDHVEALELRLQELRARV